MSMKRTCPISNSISFLISAGIQELTLHCASFVNLLLVQVSRGKAADYRTILRKYVVKLRLPAKRARYCFRAESRSSRVRKFALLFRRERRDDFLKARIAAERVPEGQ